MSKVEGLPLKSVVVMQVDNSGVLVNHHPGWLIEGTKEIKKNIQRKIFTVSQILSDFSGTADEDFVQRHLKLPTKRES